MMLMMRIWDLIFSQLLTISNNEEKVTQWKPIWQSDIEELRSDGQ